MRPTEWYGMEELPIREGWYDVWVEGAVRRYRFANNVWAGLAVDAMMERLDVKRLRWRGMIHPIYGTRHGSGTPVDLDAMPPWPFGASAWERDVKGHVNISALAGADDEIWQCRDGRRIPVGEMHIDHMRNALRMILRAKREIDDIRKAVVLKSSVIKSSKLARSLDRVNVERAVRDGGW